jgi:hypothetical protein
MGMQAMRRRSHPINRGKAGMNKPKFVPTGKDVPCEFCGEPQHFGACDELRAAQETAAAELKPVPNPRVRN